MPFLKPKKDKTAKTAKTKKVSKKAVDNSVVDCSNCNKKYTNDGNALCVACRQV